MDIQGVSEKTHVTVMISIRKQEQKETWMGLAFCNAARRAFFASVELAKFISPEHTASKTAKPNRADAVSIYMGTHIFLVCPCAIAGLMEQHGDHLVLQ